MPVFIWVILINLALIFAVDLNAHAFRVHEVIDGNVVAVLPSEVTDKSKICKPDNVKINYWIDRNTIPKYLTLPDVREAIRIAVEGWEKIEGLTSAIEFREIFTAPEPLFNDSDDVTVVAWDISGQEVNGSKFARASIGCYPETIKYTSGSDIYLNGHSSQLFWTTSPSIALVSIGTIYLPGILTHEFGHVLGLGHSEELLATMTPMPILPRAGIGFYQDVIGWTSLEIDDIKGTEFLYGKKCHSIEFPNLSPEGFGAPYTTQTNEHELLIQAECEEDQAFITVGDSASSLLTYVWPTIHYWYNGQRIATELTCTERVNGWCRYSGETTIDLNPDETWLIGYVCQWDGAQWHCGCRDESCDPKSGTGDLWLAQRIQQ